jgi:tripartite-type tricarboxylate transporter receptor subunit TctC
LLCCGLSSFAATVQAQVTAPGYPDRPVRFIVPFTAGQLVDVFARAVAQHLSARLGQAVVVENRPGASQAIALEAAAKSPPDGHTILMGTQSGLVLLTASRKTLPYDPLRDFAPITMMFATQLYLVVHPSVPARSVRELVALAKAQPGKLNYASTGNGGGHHLIMEMFKTRTGVDMVHVPFNGNGPAQMGVLTGQVHVMFEGPTILTHVRSGKLRALASSGPKRAVSTPDLPTVSEAGVPGFEMSTWFGLAAPAGVPQPIIDRLNREVGDMLRLPSTREKFALYDIELISSTPDEMRERIRSEIPLWSKVMRAAGIEPE